MTKSERQLSDNFGSNRGKLPYPVTGRYTVVATFGEQQHAELKYVRTSNSGIDIQATPGADARAVFNGVVTRVFVDALQFDTQIAGADLIFTGEGKLDAQTCMGKTPLGILRRAQRQGIPVVAIGGAVEASELLNQCGFLAVLPILPYPTSLAKAMDPTFTRQNIERTLTQVLRLYSHSAAIGNKKSILL